MAQPTKAEDYLFIDPSAFQIAGRSFNSYPIDEKYPLYGEPVAWFGECVAARCHFGIKPPNGPYFGDSWDNVPVPMSPLVSVSLTYDSDGRFVPLGWSMAAVYEWTGRPYLPTAIAVCGYFESQKIKEGTKVGPTKNQREHSSFLNDDMADWFSDWDRVTKVPVPKYGDKLEFYPLWRASVALLQKSMCVFVVDSTACDATMDDSQEMTGTLIDKSDKGWVGTVGTGDEATKYDKSLDELRTAFEKACKNGEGDYPIHIFSENAHGQLVSPKESTTYGLNLALFSWTNTTKVKFTFPRTNRYVKAVAPVYRIHAWWNYNAYGVNGDNGSGDQNYALYVGAWQDVSTSTTGPATVEVPVSECLKVGQDYLGGSDGPEMEGLWLWLNQKGALTIDEGWVGTGIEGYLNILPSDRTSGNLDICARITEWLVKFEE